MTASPTERERVGIFGGSFNPPHVAHQIIADFVLDQFELDRILWIPNHQSPLKDRSELADAEDRLAMTHAATAGNEAFEVSDCELRRAGLSYTIDTVAELQEQQPETEFHLMIGSDSLAGLDRWHQPRRLLERVPFIVFPRPGHPDAETPAGFEDRVIFADAPLLQISSSSIRERSRSDRSIRYLVPERVYEYIRTHRLYR